MNVHISRVIAGGVLCTFTTHTQYVYRPHTRADVPVETRV